MIKFDLSPRRISVSGFIDTWFQDVISSSLFATAVLRRVMVEHRYVDLLN